MSNWAIVTEGLGKRYARGNARAPQTFFGAWRAAFMPSTDEGFWALRDVSFEVETGSKLGIIGPNGAGKSTLLKLLSRVTTPTEGTAKIRGRVASLLEVGTGFHPELTGRENIFLNGAILGLSQADIRKSFDAIVDFSGVEKFIDTPVKHYSSGMHVRLAFSVAAQLEPDIIIIDEVLTVGDAAFQKKCQRQINEASKDGRTIILVSHAMSTINTICEQTILLRNGRVESRGRSSDVTETYSAESEALNYYTESAVRAYPDNSNNAVIRRVAVQDRDGIARRVFDAGEPIAISIDYEIKQPIAEAMLCCGIGHAGKYIFSTHDTDINPALMGLRNPGCYRATFQIPNRLLLSAIYTVYPAMAIGKNGANGFDGCPDAVSFEIRKSEANAEANAMVSINPKWRTDRLRAA